MMIQPFEFHQNLPIELSNGAVSSTTSVWNILNASINGDLTRVIELTNECPELIYAQYNYAPPIHFAVREGHQTLVKHLLDQGAVDPEYKIYPFQDSLQTIAQDRNYSAIVKLLEEYSHRPSRWKYKGDNGRIIYNRTTIQRDFEEAVDKEDLARTEAILISNPEFVHDKTYFWSEGIMMMPAKDNNQPLVELLMRYGAKVPDLLKWTQNYYFKHYEMAAFLMEKGMNPNTMSCHKVTLLHDMAQKGNITKAELLIRHGAAIDPIDEQYQSTPLGMAVRWGNMEMVEYLLKEGADPNRAGAAWARPLSWAKKKGYEEMELILINKGASLA